MPTHCHCMSLLFINLMIFLFTLSARALGPFCAPSFFSEDTNKTTKNEFLSPRMGCEVKESLGQRETWVRASVWLSTNTVQVCVRLTMCDNNERQSSENDCASDFNPIFYAMTMLLDFILFFLHSFSFVFLWRKYRKCLVVTGDSEAILWLKR